MALTGSLTGMDEYHWNVGRLVAASEMTQNPSYS